MTSLAVAVLTSDMMCLSFFLFEIGVGGPFGDCFMGMHYQSLLTILHEPSSCFVKFMIYYVLPSDVLLTGSPLCILALRRPGKICAAICTEQP